MSKKCAVDTEMRGAAFCACVAATPVLHFPDNVVALCCHCGRRVQHRPYVPREVRKLCCECAVDEIAKDATTELKITPRQLEDVIAAVTRRRH
jgi:hypothetical protein